MALLALKQYEKAVEYFDKSLSLNPKAVKTIALKGKFKFNSQSKGITRIR
jgi:tetratricopeptide (TPR) repeat protein